MVKIVSREEMKLIEKAADASGLSYAEMMENAGRAVANVIIDMLGTENEGKHVVALVGTGNNGGDGLVAARIVRLITNAVVTCYFQKARDSGDPVLTAAREAGVGFVDAETDKDRETLVALLATADIVVDAILGTGARLPLSDDIADLLHAVKHSIRSSEPGAESGYAQVPQAKVTGRRTKVIAVDCPSGLDCDTGDIDPATLAADVTVTFAAAKRGHLRFPGAETVGKLEVSSIGISADLPELSKISDTLATIDEIAGQLPARSRNSHKGSYGRALIIAGSVNYAGAAVLAGTAAYRVGAGLVNMAIPTSIYGIAASQLPEAVWTLLPDESGGIAAKALNAIGRELDEAEAVLVGPGLGQAPGTRSFLGQLLQRNLQQQALPRDLKTPVDDKSNPRDSVWGCSFVIDADGLNLLCQHDDWHNLLPPHCVLTPHVGEMTRLTGLSAATIQANRAAIALEYAGIWQCEVVLKGAFTVIASPERQTVTLPFATDALATAGTGDILAGCITGLLAQGLTPHNAAVVGAFVHGLAGEVAGASFTNRSTIARDVLQALPAVFAAVESI